MVDIAIAHSLNGQDSTTKSDGYYQTKPKLTKQDERKMIRYSEEKNISMNYDQTEENDQMNC